MKFTTVIVIAFGVFSCYAGTIPKQINHIRCVDDTTPSNPDVDTTPSNPDVDTTPPNPDVDTTPPKPDVDTTPPNPDVDTTPPKPDVDTTPPKPDVDTTPPKPDVDTTPPKPDVDTTPPKPGVDTTPPKPGVDTTPPKPGVDTTTTEPIVSKCNNGPIHCCNELKSYNELNTKLASTVSNFIGGSLEKVLQGQFGIACTPVAVLAASGNQCSQQSVCCDNIHQSSLVGINCTPINLSG